MRLILLQGDLTIAEFGFFRFDNPPAKAVSFLDRIYVLSHPLTIFGANKTREIVGWHYRLTQPLTLRPQDQLDAQQRREMP